jgi:hypothetical protein
MDMFKHIYTTHLLTSVCFLTYTAHSDAYEGCCEWYRYLLTGLFSHVYLLGCTILRTTPSSSYSFTPHNTKTHPLIIIFILPSTTMPPHHHLHSPPYHHHHFVSPRKSTEEFKFCARDWKNPPPPPPPPPPPQTATAKIRPETKGLEEEE